MKKENKLEKKFKSKKQFIFYKFRQKLRELIIISKNLMISPLSFIINTHKKSNIIFNFKFTKDLFFALKTLNFDLARNILLHNQHLVFDIDQFSSTPLHYAAKYNFFNIIPLILGLGAYVDSKNEFGETPLYICIKRNFYESILVLFLYFASPFVSFNEGKKIKDINKDFKTNFICEKIKDIHIRNLICKPKNFYANIKNDIFCFILDECKGYIKPECFYLVKEQYDYFK